MKDWSLYKKITRVIFILLFFHALTPVVGQQLSKNAQLSLITCGPTDHELYAAFGHSALRVRDSVQHIDWVYNYGTFDFDQPHFYLNFARGYLLYRLSVYPYEPFFGFYQAENRSVREVVLRLSQSQKQRLFDFLQHNALPENQSYFYDYFYDNCSTRVWLAMEKALPNEILFEPKPLANTQTVRQLTDAYLARQAWGDLGIDICLGYPMDKVMTPKETMFLPDYLEKGFLHAKVRDSTGTWTPLAQPAITRFNATPEKTPFPFFHPAIVFSLFCLVVLMITFFDWKKARKSYWLDVPLFMLVGLIGMLLTALWFFTDHHAASTNYNILWASPLHFFAAMFYIFSTRIGRRYFQLYTVLYAALLLGWFWLPQALNPNLLPLAVALGARSLLHGFSPRA